MKKYIYILIIFTLVSSTAFSQIIFTENKHYTDEQLKKSLDSLIKKAHYIFDASLVILNGNLGDSYYVKEENQIYFRWLVKVNFVYKGKDIHVGDTIINIFKQGGKGDKARIINGNSYLPLIFPLTANNATKESCLLLTESAYPKKINDELAGKKQMEFIKTDLGYFAGNYDMEYNPPIAVSFPIAYCLKRSDWYDYLKKFPGIKVPEVKK